MGTSSPEINLGQEKAVQASSIPASWIIPQSDSPGKS